MKRFKGTKEKWLLHKDFKEVVVADVSNVAIATCYTSSAISKNKMYANARLISKAPELLEAAITMQKRLDQLINATPSGDSRNKMTDENIQLVALIDSIFK